MSHCAEIGIHQIKSPALVLSEKNIDTDQIIPARFLTTTQRTGLGENGFADWRRDKNGELRTDCALNQSQAKECSILVAGHNFGCGSSREHAPWTLYDMGIRAVVSTQIADIFRANAAKNGIVPVVIPDAAHRRLIANPWCSVEIDLDSRCISFLDEREIPFPLDPFTRRCLMDGVDELGYLLQQHQAISEYENKHKS